VADETRELVLELRADLARIRQQVARNGDDLEIVRDRLDELLVVLNRIADVEERREERERLEARERASERKDRRIELRAREKERIEARRWWRVSVAERILLPAATAVVSVLLSRWALPLPESAAIDDVVPTQSPPPSAPLPSPPPSGAPEEAPPPPTPEAQHD